MNPTRLTLSISILLQMTVTMPQSLAQSRDELTRLEIEGQTLIDAEPTTLAKNGEAMSKYRFTTPGGVHYELAYVEDGVPIYTKTTNLSEAELIHARRPRNDLGLSGKDVRIGLWEAGGHPFMHPEFAGRLSIAAQSGQFPANSHATHVAGTLAAAGIDAEATGLAPEAELVSYDFRFDYVEMYDEAQKGLRVSNHSYSRPVGWMQGYSNGSFYWMYRDTGSGFGEYGVDAWFFDDVMWQNPYYLAVKAAGNEAGEAPPDSVVSHFHNGRTSEVFHDHHDPDCASGFGCLDPKATSKNALVVGALDASGERIADFSSRGPTLDGRIKPDVVSAGTGVYSTLGQEGYGTSSGTSMATPTVAGSIALMIELERKLFGASHEFRSSTVKALLIHGADDLGNRGPDYKYGWGRVNLAETVELMTSSTRSEVAILEPSLDNELVFDFESSGDFKVTMSWIDPIGRNPNVIIDKSQPVLVEDVDIVVVKDGIEYRPFVLDPSNPDAPAVAGVNTVDNVEQVDLSSLPAGPVRVTVTRKGNGTAPLSVSLVVSGIQGQSTTTSNEPQTAFESGSVNVYPNPVAAGQQVHIEGGQIELQMLEVDVVDQMGRLVESLYRGMTDRLDLGWDPSAQIASGTYFIRIHGERFESSHPVAVVR